MNCSLVQRSLAGRDHVPSASSAREKTERLRLRCAADVAVVQSADLRQGNDLAVVGGSTARGSGASLARAKCVREL